jgi:formylglycine-generating enzyme required for sulfatase activity
MADPHEPDPEPPTDDQQSRAKVRRRQSPARSARDSVRAERIRTDPPWLMTAGLVFGAIVLISFLALAWYAGQHRGFVCESHRLLAAVFAFGAALSGAFLGGTAAVHGGFGKQATYSAGGGVAFFLITFVLFNHYPPDPATCAPPSAPQNKEAELIFQDLPTALVMYSDQFWTRDSFGDADHHTVYLLARGEQVNGKYPSGKLSLQDANRKEWCSVQLNVEPSQASFLQIGQAITFPATSSIHFSVDLKWSKTFDDQRKHPASEKATDRACFTYTSTNQSIGGSIGIALDESKLFLSSKPADIEAELPAPDNGRTTSWASVFSEFISRTEAAPESTPFEALKASLADPDPNRRAAARQFLEANFDQYADQAIDDLFSTKQDPEYVAGLLSGLIAGIDRKTDGKFAPGKARDLSVSWPYSRLADHDGLLVDMTGSPNESVRRQARRLVQRFPLDSFDKVYVEIAGRAAKGCSEFTAANKQGILYGGIFYYYNRILQFGYNSTFDAGARKSLDDEAAKGAKLATCLDANLKVDAASLIFAKAFAYSLHKDFADKAAEFARQFLEATDKQPDYFSPSHIETAKRFAFVPLSIDRERSLQPKAAFKECTMCPEMVVVPAGPLTIGSPPSDREASKDESPQQNVIFAKPFAVGRFPVTFDEWDACVAGGGCNGYRPRDEDWGRGRMPVIHVSWNDARAYTAWLSKTTGKSYRLLSEAEFEYAARAGTQTVYPWGNDIGKNNANCDDCGSAWDGKVQDGENTGTAPVGTFPANLFGLYDMHGNVWQWVEDCYHKNYNGIPPDGSAWTRNCEPEKASRAGAWNLDHELARSANRGKNTATMRGEPTASDKTGVRNHGFRVGRTLEP